MIQTASTRIRKAVAPIVFAVVALGMTALIAGAVDELALPPAALGLDSIALLAAAGTLYYRMRTMTRTQPVATPLNITYAAHWDMGTPQIGADAPLSNGAPLCLVPGVKAVTTTLQTDDLVGAGHAAGGVADEHGEHQSADAR